MMTSEIVLNIWTNDLEPISNGHKPKPILWSQCLDEHCVHRFCFLFASWTVQYNNNITGISKYYFGSEFKYVRYFVCFNIENNIYSSIFCACEFVHKMLQLFGKKGAVLLSGLLLYLYKYTQMHLTNERTKNKNWIADKVNEVPHVTKKCRDVSLVFGLH